MERWIDEARKRGKKRVIRCTRGPLGNCSPLGIANSGAKYRRGLLVYERERYALSSLCVRAREPAVYARGH